MTATELIARLEVRPLHLGTLTISLEYRKCGKCSRCPHGPYIYIRDKTGKRRYLGAAARLTDRDLNVAFRAAGVAPQE
jgi:hypothetical protein